MLKSFLIAYEQGYAAGLRQATILPDECSAFSETDFLAGELTELLSRPAYKEGFLDGFKDGAGVLRHNDLSEGTDFGEDAYEQRNE